MNKLDKTDGNKSLLKLAMMLKGQRKRLPDKDDGAQPQSHMLSLGQFFPPQMGLKFKQMLSNQSVEPEKSPASPSDLDKNALKLRQNLEKLSALIREKDKRILELQQYEYSAKKAIEQKTWLQEELESERHKVKLLEKEKESQASALTESRQHAQQLERAIQFLQQRNEIILSEKNHLQESFQESETLATNLKEAYEEYRQLAANLEAKLTDELDNRQELSNELGALYKQFENLKRIIETQKQQLEEQNNLRSQAEWALASSENEKARLQENFAACQKEVAAIKEHVTKGMREAKELENRYAEAIDEKINASRALHQLQREFDKQHQEYLQAKEKLKNCLDREKSILATAEESFAKLKHRSSMLENELAKQRSKQEEIHDRYDLLLIKNELIENERDRLQVLFNELSQERETYGCRLQQIQDELAISNQENAAFRIQNERFAEEAALQQALLEEKQAMLDEAHQHLAKKVREAALLHDRVEELSAEMHQSNSALAALQEAHQQLENEILKNQCDHSENSEKLEKYETEIKQWEEKWLLAERRAQQAAEKIIELEKIEQCHIQLQSLLSGFGALSGVSLSNNKLFKEPTTQPPVAPTLTFGHPPPVEEELVDEPLQKETGKAYPNLFDMPATQPRQKQSLFD